MAVGICAPSARGALVRSGTDVQSSFQSITKVFSGVELRALCRPLKLFHSKLIKPCFHGAQLAHKGSIMLQQSLQRVATRAFTTTARQMKNRVPERQKLFQEDNGLPVHIKGGSTDMLLYRVTMTLTIVGTGFSFYWLLVASMPRSKAE